MRRRNPSETPESVVGVRAPGLRARYVTDAIGTGSVGADRHVREGDEVATGVVEEHRIEHTRWSLARTAARVQPEEPLELEPTAVEAKVRPESDESEEPT